MDLYSTAVGWSDSSHSTNPKKCWYQLYVHPPWSLAIVICLKAQRAIKGLGSCLVMMVESIMIWHCSKLARLTVNLLRETLCCTMVLCTRTIGESVLSHTNTSNIPLPFRFTILLLVWCMFHSPPYPLPGNKEEMRHLEHWASRKYTSGIWGGCLDAYWMCVFLGWF